MCFLCMAFQTGTRVQTLSANLTVVTEAEDWSIRNAGTGPARMPQHVSGLPTTLAELCDAEIKIRDIRAANLLLRKKGYL